MIYCYKKKKKKIRDFFNVAGQTFEIIFFNVLLK